MNYYDRINSVFEQIQLRGNVEFAIYPYGKIGKKLEKYVKGRTGKEPHLFDNNLHDGKFILRIDDVEEDCNKYTWLVACESSTTREKLLYSLKQKGINEENIIDFFDTSYETESPVISIELHDLIVKLRKTKSQLAFAEIGIDKGKTSIGICKRLSKNDQFWFFDFYDRCQDVNAKLQAVTPRIECDLIPVGNDYKKYDSYAWGLSELLLKMFSDKKRGIFDLVYLDGAHDFFHDGLACCIIKELMKSDGYLVFDDVDWTIANSPNCNPDSNPAVLDDYTMAQIDNEQVGRVVDCFVQNDNRFKKIFDEFWDNKRKAVFKKVSY